jgi:hypothetical protein
MGDDEPHPAIARIIREHGAHDVVEALGAHLSGADFTSLMLEVIRRRAAAVRPTDVLSQYQNDRFTRPSSLDPLELHEMQLAALRVVAPTFVPIETSPLAPLGTHSAIAGVHQDRVVTTTRGTEVAADPTNSLALEAAVRRREILGSAARSPIRVHLASIDRVVRAQRFDGPLSFAHFSLLGLVTAGRDTGHHAFETESLRQHIQMLAAVVERLGYGSVRVELTDFDRTHSEVVDTVQRDMAGDTIAVSLDPQRETGRSYYVSLCFKLSVMTDDGPIEVADGGIVDWTQSLLGSNKERLMISGLSLDRLAALDPN